MPQGINYAWLKGDQALWYVLAAMASNTMYLSWFIIAKKQNQLGDRDEIWILSNVNKMKEGTILASELINARRT